MFKTLKPRLVPLAIAGLAIFAISTPAFAQKPPKGGSGGTTLPPVRYQVQFWSILGAHSLNDIHDTNNLGQTVGSVYVDLNGDGQRDTIRGFFYDPAISLEQGFDLNSIVSGIPAGWEIRSATAINESGQIAAYITPIRTSLSEPLERLQPAMIDMNGEIPVLHVVPDRHLTQYSLAGDINDWGDLVVRYSLADGTKRYYVFNFDPAWGLDEPLDLGVATSSGNHPKINNARTVVGQIGSGTDAFRLTWNGTMKLFPGVSVGFGDLNANGAFSGAQRVTEKNRTSNIACICDASTTLYSPYSFARDVNASKDFLIVTTLYHQQAGSLKVDDLLDPTDPDSATLLGRGGSSLYTLTDRDALTGFPLIIGQWTGGQGVLFTPIPVR